MSVVTAILLQKFYDSGNKDKCRKKFTERVRELFVE